jgi:NADH:ubiquinone oxidoreductase subunit
MVTHNILRSPAGLRPLDGQGARSYGPRGPKGRHSFLELAVAQVLDKIFTWWSGATIGTLFTVGRNGVKVGEDEFGNRYYEARTNRNSYDGRKRRWVIYSNYADASKVPPEWHGWLHYTFDELPSEATLPKKSFEKPHVPNLSGTPFAWRPKGSLARGGKRPSATGDYQAWTPDQ